MMKRATSVVIAFCIILFSVITASGHEIFDLSRLSDCNALLAYSGSSHAYFYGYTKSTLYSATVGASVTVRNVSVDGIIRAVAHDELSAYAMYQTQTPFHGYSVVCLDMQDGSCANYSIGVHDYIDYTSFAVADDEFFIIANNANFAYAESYSKNGERKFNYKISNNNVVSLFSNNSRAYAVLDNGEVYRIGNGKHTYIANIGSAQKLINAGVDCAVTSENLLVSLSDGQTTVVNSVGGLTAKIDGTLYSVIGNTIYRSMSSCATVSNTKLIAGNKDIIAVVNSAMECEVYSLSELDAKADTSSEPPNSQSRSSDGTTYQIDGDIIFGFACGDKVRSYDSLTFYDKNGNIVTSGSIKTGYDCLLSGTRYSVAVSGDITGEGNLNTRDISALMKFIVGTSQLSGVYLKSADYNLDGTADTRDLVLIAQQYERSSNTD